MIVSGKHTEKDSCGRFSNSRSLSACLLLKRTDGLGWANADMNFGIVISLFDGSYEREVWIRALSDSLDWFGGTGGIACQGIIFGLTAWLSWRRLAKRVVRPIIVSAMKGSAIVSLAWLVIVSLHFFYLSPKAIYEAYRKEHALNQDLTVTVISYRYNDAASELIADIQLINNGSAIRTVTGIFHMTRLEIEDDCEAHLLVDDPDKAWGVDAPLYVEHDRPIVKTIKQHVDKALLSDPDNLFGLQIRIIDVNGGSIFTNIDIMELKAFRDGIGRRTKRVERRSLEAGYPL